MGGGKGGGERPPGRGGSSGPGRSALRDGPSRGRGRKAVRRVMDESSHEAEAILQSAATPIGEFKAQLCDAGVLLRQGLGHGGTARRELVRRGRLSAGREVGRRLEQAQAETLLLAVRLQGGDCAAELENLELEAVMVRGARVGSRCGLAGLRLQLRRGSQGGGGGQLRRGGPALRGSPRTGLEASDHLPLKGGLVPRLAQSALRQVRHVRSDDGDRMRSSEDRTACSDALVIGEGEYGGAFVGGSPSSGDPAAFLVRELSDGSSVQLGAGEEQLGANTFVLLLDAVAAMARNNADIRDFEHAEFHGWHAPRSDESRRTAEHQ